MSFRPLTGDALPGERLPTSRALQGEVVSGERFAITTAAGEERVVSAYAVPLVEGERITGVLALWHDITERYRAEQALGRYRQIVETSSEMLIFLDRQLRYQVVNPACAAFHGLTPDEIQGRHIRQVVAPELWSRNRRHLYASLRGEPRRFTLEATDACGRRRWLEIDQRPFREAGAVVGIVLSLHDFTEVQEAQKALEAQRQHLEERVAARTAELQASEAKLRTIYDLVPVGISITDPAGQLIDCNLASEPLLGLTREAHLKRTYDGPEWDLVRPDGTPMPSDEYASVRAMREDRPVQDMEMGVLRPDRTTWLSVSATPARHPDFGVVIAFVDITERRQAHRTLRSLMERLQLAADAGGVGVWEWDMIENRLTWDERTCQLYGRPPGAAPRTYADWCAMLHPDERPAIEGALAALMTGPETAFRTSFQVLWPDGTAGYLTSSGKVIRDAAGTAQRLIGVNWDITDLRRAREEAAQAARSKAEFLAHMSHEIRTPMNGITGLSELALREPLAPLARDYLEKIHQSGMSLLGLLNDILDHSRIEAGRLGLNLIPFDLHTLLANLHTLFAQAAMAQGLRLTIESAPQVPRYLLGDPLRLQQVLSNLLGNALKFTPGGQVGLRVTGAAREASWVDFKFRVTDTGIGIDAAARARLFEPFAQGDASIARRFGGSGLGLYISRNLARLMGGDLVVESSPGVGSTFTLELRLQLAATVAPAIGTAPVPGANLAGLRLLVAEDHPINQQVIGGMLRLLGVRVTLASDGREALERLAEADFDAVLMDIQMPEMDGLAATRLIRGPRAGRTCR